jgi:hypothetical protein
MILLLKIKKSDNKFSDNLREHKTHLKFIMSLIKLLFLNSDVFPYDLVEYFFLQNQKPSEMSKIFQRLI